MGAGGGSAFRDPRPFMFLGSLPKVSKAKKGMV